MTSFSPSIAYFPAYGSNMTHFRKERAFRKERVNIASHPLEKPTEYFTERKIEYDVYYEIVEEESSLSVSEPCP